MALVCHETSRLLEFTLVAASEGNQVCKRGSTGGDLQGIGARGLYGDDLEHGRL